MNNFDGKKHNCPDCMMHNKHPDTTPQINFCNYCERSGNVWLESINNHFWEMIDKKEDKS